MALPIVIPEICMGVALLVFFARVGRVMASFEAGRSPGGTACSPLAAQSLGHHHRAYRLFVPLRRRGGAGAHGRGSTASLTRRHGSRRLANGRPSGM